MDPIFERSSIRAWTDEAVDEETILTILKAAMQAPSAVNSQPWQFIVVRNEAVKKQLADLSPYAHFAGQAPVILALLCRKENACPLYNEIDMGICIENILLEITEQKLGGVCLGIAPIEERMKAMAEVLHVPDSLDAFALIAFGHPKGTYKPVDRFDPSRIQWID